MLELLCDSFHYVILDVGNMIDPLAGDAFDHASRVYLVADRSVHSTRETIRLLRFIEDRDNNPPTSLLLNNPNAATAGKVEAADFTSAVGRTALHEIQFEVEGDLDCGEPRRGADRKGVERLQPDHHANRT